MKASFAIQQTQPIKSVKQMKKQPTHRHVKKRTTTSHSCPCWLLPALGVLLVFIVTGVLLYFLQQNAPPDTSEPAHVSAAFSTPTPEPTPEPASEEPSEEPDATPEPTPEPAAIPIDFSYYRTSNSDVFGWIEVDGTDISYPVLYDATNNNYYLDHTWLGEYTLDGSIFVQNYNTKGFTDFNTVLYGHNMNSGAMFAQLHRFKDESFFEENRHIIIYTPDSKLTYEIFAAYRTDDLHILANFDMSTADSRTAYIDRIYTHTTNAVFDGDITVTESDNIITLSTCIGISSNRYLVQGILILEEPGVYTPE